MRRDIDPPTTFVPSSREFDEAVRLGVGWAMVPTWWADQHLADGTLVTGQNPASSAAAAQQLLALLTN